MQQINNFLWNYQITDVARQMAILKRETPAGRDRSWAFAYLRKKPLDNIWFNGNIKL